MADFASNSSPVALSVSQYLRDQALEAGFDEAGVVPLPYLGEHRDGARFAEWIRQGRGASMDYLARTDELGRLLRQSVQTPFPWAKSVLVCWSSYHFAGERSIDPASADRGWIARYAWTSRLDPQRGRQPGDYHKILLRRLHAVEAKTRAQYGEVTLRSFVDTGPVVERSLAVAAGLGWRGKNTCLIHPKLGSFGFLAVLLTSLESGCEDAPMVLPDRCGSCTRCIDACPTGALTAPYQMDAARCIAYLTIEEKGVIQSSLMEKMGRQIFGCDICQEVCPWNRKAPCVSEEKMASRAELINPALQTLAALDEAGFERLFNGSPVRRAGFDGLRRNLAVAMGNSGLPQYLSRLEEWSNSTNEALRHASLRALRKLRTKTMLTESRQSNRR